MTVSPLSSTAFLPTISNLTEEIAPAAIAGRTSRGERTSLWPQLIHRCSRCRHSSGTKVKCIRRWSRQSRPESRSCCCGTRQIRLHDVHVAVATEFAFAACRVAVGLVAPIVAIEFADTTAVSAPEFGLAAVAWSAAFSSDPSPQSLS